MLFLSFVIAWWCWCDPFHFIIFKSILAIQTSQLQTQIVGTGQITNCKGPRLAHRPRVWHHGPPALFSIIKQGQGAKAMGLESIVPYYWVFTLKGSPSLFSGWFFLLLERRLFPWFPLTAALLGEDVKPLVSPSSDNEAAEVVWASVAQELEHRRKVD